MGIKYRAGTEFVQHPNGSRSFRTPDAYATLAKVENCPCEDGKRRNAFATAYPDTFFSVPACVYVGKKTVAGFLASDEDGYRFIVVETGKNAALIKKASSAQI
jgi:hypothetical protein